MDKPTQGQLEALWKSVYAPVLTDYIAVSGYTQKNRIKEKLIKLFGGSKERPSLFEFTEKIISDLGETAAGRNKPTIEGDLDRNQMAARKDLAHAEKLEMENDLRRGELIDAAEHDLMNAEVDGIIRSNFLSLSSRLAKELAEINNPREVQIFLNEKIRETLSSLGDES